MSKSEEILEITIEVKAGVDISTAEASKYANKYVQAFVGSYRKISPEGRKMLKEAGVLEHGSLSIEKIRNTIKRYDREIEEAKKIINRSRQSKK